MKQALSIALLLVAATCLSAAHEHLDWKGYKHDSHFTLKFDYAARQGVGFGSNSFTVSWNGEEIYNKVPEDYFVNAVVLTVKGKSGENTLTFQGTGKSDSLGAGITNVQLLRQTYCGEEDAVVNGLFNQGTNVGHGWKIFNSIPGWTATHQIEIGYGKIYNKNWPVGTHITELDVRRNTAISQTITLDERHRLVHAEDN